MATENKLPKLAENIKKYAAQYDRDTANTTTRTAYQQQQQKQKSVHDYTDDEWNALWNNMGAD